MIGFVVCDGNGLVRIDFVTRHVAVGGWFAEDLEIPINVDKLFVPSQAPGKAGERDR